MRAVWPSEAGAAAERRERDEVPAERRGRERRVPERLLAQAARARRRDRAQRHEPASPASSAQLGFSRSPARGEGGRHQPARLQRAALGGRLPHAAHARARVSPCSTRARPRGRSRPKRRRTTTRLSRTSAPGSPSSSSARTSVVVKDPRIGWFLPLWRRCAERARARDRRSRPARGSRPRSVRSARQWYGTWQSDASRAAAWLNVTLHTELATRGARRALRRATTSCSRTGRGEIARVGRLLDVPWLAGLERARHPAGRGVRRPGPAQCAGRLGRASPSRAVLRDQVDRVWELVSALAGRTGTTRRPAALDEARARPTSQLYGEAEAIAQSSVTAVKPRRGRTGLAAGGGRPHSNARNGRRSPWRLVVRVLPAKRLPAPRATRARCPCGSRCSSRTALPRAGVRSRSCGRACGCWARAGIADPLDRRAPESVFVE